MGRVKLKIKRLESRNNRQVTYSKRKNGIMKKAYELSVLCDIDIILLMFAPNGKPAITDHSNLEHIIAKFAQITPQERAKRKLETLEVLKKTFKKLDHDVNIDDFLGSSSQTVEELRKQVRMLRTRFGEVQKRLSFWNNPDKVDNLEYLRQMEGSLKDSLHRIQLHKEIIGKNQLMSLDCSSEVVNCLSDFQTGLPLPMVMSAMQESQSHSWIPKNDAQQIIFNDDEPNFLSQRGVKCSVDSNLIPGFCGYFTNSSKQMENMDNSSGQVDNPSGPPECGSGLNDIPANGCLGIQIGEHYPYSPYGSISLLDEHNEKIMGESTANEIDFQGINSTEDSNPFGDIHHNHQVIYGSCDLPGSIYTNGFPTWVPAAGPCNIPIFSDNPFPQLQPN